jgi:hypothetical protein
VFSAASVELVVAAALVEQCFKQTQPRLGLFVDGVLLLLGLSVFFLQPSARGVLELVLEVTQFPAQPMLQLLGLRLPCNKFSPGNCKKNCSTNNNYLITSVVIYQNCESFIYIFQS